MFCSNVFVGDLWIVASDDRGSGRRNYILKKGTIFVHNLSYRKEVGFHIKVNDHWIDLHASFSHSLLTSDSNTIEVWQYTSDLAFASEDLTAHPSFKTFQLAIFYHNLDWRTSYWDNNSGRDYFVTVTNALEHPVQVNCLKTIADLRATMPDSIVFIKVLGYYEEGDGGGGDFYWQASSTEADNSGTVIKPASLLQSEPGRWKRLYDGQLSVRWFGARGNNSDDCRDTIAIQAAANAAHQAVVVIKPEGVTYMGSGPSVYFPPGIYRLKNEITMGPYTFVLGEGHPILQQDCAACRILVWAKGYTAGLSGLKLVGGTHQVYYANANIDTSRFDVTDCEFQLSSDFAIYTEGLTDGHLSALVIIQRSKFCGNKVLHNVADWTVFRDNWVTASPPADSAAFENRSGILMIENMLGVPGSLSGNRWIDNYDSLYVNNTRFGGEDGGIPIVHHFLKPNFNPAVYPFMGPSIVIENSWCFAGGNRSDRAVVTLRSAVPNIIKFVGNTGPVEAPYVRVGEGMDIQGYLTPIQNTFSKSLSYLFQVEIGPNVAIPFDSAYQYGTYLPDELKPYLYNSNQRNIYNINRPGSLTISGADATGAVTFTFVEPDDNYYVIAIVSNISGTPAAGATRVYVTNKAASGFTINLEAAPGMGNSVTVDWHLVR